MILVDTSVWVDHLRRREPALADLLEAGGVVTHPFVIGELSLGRLRQRDIVLGALRQLPRAAVATDRETLDFIDRNALHGRGIGYVDAHLLAAARLSADTLLWTRDRRLAGAAERLGVGAEMG